MTIKPTVWSYFAGLFIISIMYRFELILRCERNALCFHTKAGLHGDKPNTNAIESTTQKQSIAVRISRDISEDDKKKPAAFNLSLSAAAINFQWISDILFFLNRRAFYMFMFGNRQANYVQDLIVFIKKDHKIAT